jgi:hypothetical protein
MAIFALAGVADRLRHAVTMASEILIKGKNPKPGKYGEGPGMRGVNLEKVGAIAGDFGFSLSPLRPTSEAPDHSEAREAEIHPPARV